MRLEIQIFEKYSSSKSWFSKELDSIWLGRNPAWLIPINSTIRRIHLVNANRMQFIKMRSKSWNFNSTKTSHFKSKRTVGIILLFYKITYWNPKIKKKHLMVLCYLEREASETAKDHLKKVAAVSAKIDIKTSFNIHAGEIKSAAANSRHFGPILLARKKKPFWNTGACAWI